MIAVIPVVYAVQAAINDAKRKNASRLKGATVYTTLFPSNTCAQEMLEAEIKELVFIHDKFHNETYSVVARDLLKGISCRVGLKMW